VNVESKAPSWLVADVADEIMAYLNENANAADTPQGIWQWWLTDRREQVDAAIVENALERLVAQGRVGKRILAAGETLYFGFGGDRRDDT
jgi:hypothetical protein